MSMSFEPGERASDVAAWFERLGAVTSKQALRGMRKVVEQVKKKAVANAPILRGDLEHAIQAREEVGTNRRIQGIVEVTDAGLTRSNVLDYAARIEDGEFEHLGERSIAKGPDVGPHFLARAFDEYADDLPEELVDQILGELL